MRCKTEATEKQGSGSGKGPEAGLELLVAAMAIGQKGGLFPGGPGLGLSFRAFRISFRICGDLHVEAGVGVGASRGFQAEC